MTHGVSNFPNSVSRYFKFVKKGYRSIFTSTPDLRAYHHDYTSSPASQISKSHHHLTLNLYQMGWASLSSLHSGSSRARFIQATTAGLLNRQPDLHQAIFPEPITTKSSDLLLIPQISDDNANKRPKSFVWNQ